MRTDARKGKILRKLLLFVLPLLVLAIVLTSAALTWTGYQAFQNTVHQDYRNIITSSSGEIRLFMNHAVHDLETLALMISVTHADPWRTEIILNAFAQRNEAFRWVTMFSPDGRPLATTVMDNRHRLDPADPFLNAALAGQPRISAVSMGDDKLPFVRIAAPLRRMGRISGVIIGELDLKRVWNILEGIRIGDSGQIFIMAPSGRIIAHKDMARVFSSRDSSRESRLRRIRETPAPIPWTEASEGVRYFFMGTYLPELDWVILLQQPSSEIYRHLFHSLAWTGLITAFLCLVTVGIGSLFVRRLLRPVRRLHQQVRNIGAGHLDRRVTVASNDEIGDLGRAFNKMTDSLKKMIRQEVENAKELTHARNLAVVGTTASKVTHEVGNLVNNLGMALSVLRSGGVSDRQERVLATLEKESGRVQDFIRRYLRFARKPELRMETVFVNQIVDQVLSANAPEMKRWGIRAEPDWPETLPPIHADAGLIYQIFDNLVKNSIDAMNQGGELKVQGRATAETVTITVSDTGSGIAPEHMDRIFDPFFTTKERQGTGLGTANVKTYVTAHRGRIRCQSTPGRGTTFTVDLPAAKTATPVD